MARVMGHAKHGNIVRGYLTARTTEIGESLLSLSKICNSM